MAILQRYTALNSGVIANFPDKSASFKFKQNITGEKQIMV